MMRNNHQRRHHQSVVTLLLAGLTMYVGMLSSVAQAQSGMRFPMIPNGGEVYAQGQEIAIRWDTSRFAHDLTISVWDGRAGTWQIIANQVPPKSGTVLWTLPSNLSGRTFRVRISSRHTDEPPLLSMAFFAIVPPQPPPIPKSNPQTVASAMQAYPNPFNPTIHFKLSTAGSETLRVCVYDQAGREVARLIGPLATQHLVVFDGTNLPSGTYFYTYTAGAEGGAGRVVLVK